MATNVTIDQILNATVAAIAVLAPSTGAAVTPSKPLFFVKRYTGELSMPEAQQRAAVGRTPCAFVGHERTRVLRTTIGRRVDRVETSIVVYVCSDAWRDRNDRSVVFAPSHTVMQAVLGARRLGLAIQPLRYQSTAKVLDDEKMLIEAVRFTTRHRVDYSKTATYDTMLDVVGEVYEGTEEAPVNPTGLHVVFP
jgi:hypothetical protein